MRIQVFMVLRGKVVTEGHIDVSHRRRITNRLLYVESNVASEEYQRRVSPVMLQLLRTFCYREKKDAGRLVCPKRDIFFGTMILNIACACRSAVV